MQHSDSLLLPKTVRQPYAHHACCEHSVRERPSCIRLFLLHVKRPCTREECPPYAFLSTKRMWEGNSSCEFLAVQIGACMVLGTVVAILIVDRAGRRQLLIIGGIQMCAAEVALTAYKAATCPASWQTYLMHVDAWSRCIACCCCGCSVLLVLETPCRACSICRQSYHVLNAPVFEAHHMSLHICTFAPIKSWHR